MEFIIYPPKSNIAFYLFNFPIHWYGIIMALCIFFGVISAEKILEKNYDKIYAQIFSDNFPFLVLISIIGARLFYVFAQFNFYKNNPLEIILINHGGLSIWGAIIFGIISVIIYSKYKKLNYLKFLDTFALVFPLCQAVGRWGNYFNQEAYGKPYEGFLKFFIAPENRLSEYQDYSYFHPAFLYESLFDILIFIILFLVFKKTRKYDGKIFYLYLILYSIVRIFMEFIRIDSVLNIANIHIAQIISAVVLIISLILLMKTLFTKNRDEN